MQGEEAPVRLRGPARVDPAAGQADLARPDIAVPRSQLLGADTMFGLHPSLKPLLPFWQDKTFGALHAVGQATPNRSHFSAMEEMERAECKEAVEEERCRAVEAIPGSSDPPISSDNFING